MTNPLEDKAALVTGSSCGIGQAAAVALDKAGTDMAVNYLSQANGAKTTCEEIERLGRRTVQVRADVSVAKEVSRLVEKVQGSLGSISILVNNAGIGPTTPLM